MEYPILPGSVMANEHAIARQVPQQRPNVIEQHVQMVDRIPAQRVLSYAQPQQVVQTVPAVRLMQPVAVPSVYQVPQVPAIVPSTHVAVKPERCCSTRVTIAVSVLCVCLLIGTCVGLWFRFGRNSGNDISYDYEVTVTRCIVLDYNWSAGGANSDKEQADKEYDESTGNSAKDEEYGEHDSESSEDKDKHGNHGENGHKEDSDNGHDDDKGHESEDAKKEDGKHDDNGHKEDSDNGDGDDKGHGSEDAKEDGKHDDNGYKEDSDNGDDDEKGHESEDGKEDGKHDGNGHNGDGENGDDDKDHDSEDDRGDRWKSVGIFVANDDESFSWMPFDTNQNGYWVVENDVGQWQANHGTWVQTDDGEMELQYGEYDAPLPLCNY